MAFMSLDDARLSQDAVLTTIVHGYRQPQFIGTRILPLVPVATRSGRVVKFGIEDFALYNTRRAPGDYIRRTQGTYSSETFSLYQDAVAEQVPVELFEEAMNGVAKVNLRNSGPRKAMRKITLGLEYDIATLVQNNTQYESSCTTALSGNDRWDVAHADSQPSQDVRAWKEAIRAQVGIYPNKAWIGPQVFAKLAEHSTIIDKFKYTSSDSVTPQMLAALWELDEVLVGTSLMVSDTGVKTDIWGKNFGLFYAPGGSMMPIPEEGAMKEEPSFGYTYQLQGYPIARPERLDEDTNSYIYTVIAEREPNLTGLGATGKVGAGFLATTVIS